MAYTNAGDVKALFRNIDIDAPGEGTAVDTAELDVMIAEVDAEINMKLNRTYVTPIIVGDSPIAFLYLGKIARMKVAHLIKTILELTNENSDRVQDVQTNLEMKADKLLDAVRRKWDAKCCEWVDPEFPLEDAEMKAISPISGSVFSYNKGTPTIIKGGNNW